MTYQAQAERMRWVIQWVLYIHGLVSWLYILSRPWLARQSDLQGLVAELL